MSDKELHLFILPSFWDQKNQKSCPVEKKLKNGLTKKQVAKLGLNDSSRLSPNKLQDEIIMLDGFI